MRDDPDDFAVLDHLFEIPLDGFLAQIVLPLLGRFRESLLLALVPEEILKDSQFALLPGQSFRYQPESSKRQRFFHLQRVKEGGPHLGAEAARPSVTPAQYLYAAMDKKKNPHAHIGGLIYSLVILDAILCNSN